MKRTFLVSVSFEGKNIKGCMNTITVIENGGFRSSHVIAVQQEAEKEIYKRYGEKSNAVVLSVSELESDE